MMLSIGKQWGKLATMLTDVSSSLLFCFTLKILCSFSTDWD